MKAGFLLKSAFIFFQKLKKTNRKWYTMVG